MSVIVEERPDGLRRFLGPVTRHDSLAVYLPRFTDSATTTPSGHSLTYGGGTFSDRDARAAVAVSTLAAQLPRPTEVHLRGSDEFLSDGPSPTGVVVGSRSSAVTPLLFTDYEAGQFFTFTFGEVWAIHWQGSIYELRNPAELSSHEYEQQTDYGIVARLSSNERNSTVFLLAGLGSRATEGCGRYFAREWHSLLANHGPNDFALLLEFPPPIDPEHCLVIGDSARAS